MSTDRPYVEEPTASAHDGACPVCGAVGPAGTRCPGAGHPEREAWCLPWEYLPAELPSDEPLAGRRFAGMLIVRTLGQGGAGSVYLALRGSLLLPVALKLMHVDATTTRGLGGRRFRREAQALARLRHPGIVRLLEFEAFEGRPYLVMEYVAGGVTLHQAMGQRALAPAVAEHVLLQLGDAMEVMHRAGVVHRDLKPGNIMLDPLPRDPWRIRLVDFGLAKLVDHGMVTRHAAGTLRYMAPEQIVSGRIGPWTDYYAAGLIAARLLTGRHAYHANDLALVLAQHRDRDFDAVAALETPLPAETEAFLRAALAWDPRRRLYAPEAFRQGVRAACAAMAAPAYHVTQIRRSDPPRVEAPATPGSPTPLLPARPRGAPVSRRALIAGAAALGVGVAGGAVMLGGSDDAPDVRRPPPSRSPVSTPPAPVAPGLARGRVVERVVAPEPADAAPPVEPAPDAAVDAAPDAAVDAAVDAELDAEVEAPAREARRRPRRPARRRPPRRAPPEATPASELMERF